MYSKSKLVVMTLSALVVFYAALVMFYGHVVAQEGGAYKEIAVFVDVLKKISDDYVDAPDMQKVMTGAMKGLVDSLDPYGGFFQKDQLDQLDKKIKEQRGDIGVVLSKKPELTYVVSTIPGSPAEKADIRPGDYVISVDDASTFNMHLREVIGSLKGETGSKVRLGVLRGSQAEPIEIAVQREEIRIPEIHQQILDGNIGYLRPSFLGSESSQQFSARLKTLQSAKVSKILLDLRYVAGGDYEQAVEITNYFIKDGLLSYTQGKEKGRKDYVAEESKMICDLPLVVLVNTSTMGAAEVIAGAVKDRNRGQLVGEKSFGSGSIQERVELKDGSILLLTTQRFFTPSGKAIQSATAKSAGVQPDFTVPDDKVKSDLLLKSYLDSRSSEGSQSYRRLMEKIDSLQMEKALGLLNAAQEATKKAA
jgi:carboxyl-terminal processing protease